MTDRRRIPPRTDTAAPSAPQAGEGAPTPRPRVDPLTRLLVLRLKDADPSLSAASIAATLGGISESTVRRLLDGQTTDEKSLTKQMMRMTSPDRIQNWERACEVAAEKGYHQPAKDYLEAAGLIEPKPTGPAVSVNPTVILNMPFALGALQAPQAPAIEAQAVPVLPAKGEA